jgi:uncharacterized membrane protein YdfJ with MMPL/SSD domain
MTLSTRRLQKGEREKPSSAVLREMHFRSSFKHKAPPVTFPPELSPGDELASVVFPKKRNIFADSLTKVAEFVTLIYNHPFSSAAALWSGDDGGAARSV